MQMGSEGWAVFAGPRMIASHLSEKQARLIEQAPNLLKALKIAFGAVEYLACAPDAELLDHQRLAIVEEAIQKARVTND